MATKLDKDISRESSEQIDGREINVTLTKDQGINLKLKGLRSDGYRIGISDLYKQLSGVVGDETKSNKGPVSVDKSNSKPSKGNPLISLHDLRTYNAISVLDYETKCAFESIIKSLIDNYPEKYGTYKKP